MKNKICIETFVGNGCIEMPSREFNVIVGCVCVGAGVGLVVAGIILLSE